MRIYKKTYELFAGIPVAGRIMGLIAVGAQALRREALLYDDNLVVTLKTSEDLSDYISTHKIENADEPN